MKGLNNFSTLVAVPATYWYLAAWYHLICDAPLNITGAGDSFDSAIHMKLRLWVAASSARCPVSFGLAGVDGVCGLVADGYTYPKTLGGKPKLITASGVISERYPPPEGRISHPVMAPSA